MDQHCGVQYSGIRVVEIARPSVGTNWLLSSFEPHLCGGGTHRQLLLASHYHLDVLHWHRLQIQTFHEQGNSVISSRATSWIKSCRKAPARLLRFVTGAVFIGVCTHLFHRRNRTAYIYNACLADPLNTDAIQVTGAIDCIPRSSDNVGLTIPYTASESYATSTTVQ